MTHLIIKYAKNFEVFRIKNTLDKLDWYNKHKYHVFLPEKINKEKDNLLELVEKEFEEKIYDKSKKELLQKFNQKICKEIENKTGKKLPDKIIVLLTRYGVGGSYFLPDKVVINIRPGFKHDILYCLKHEMIHLLIEDEVQSEDLTQEEKEAWVDKLMGE